MIAAFAAVRKFPAMVDGIRCRCECAELPSFYSLLSCFGGEGMAQHCETCQLTAEPWPASAYTVLFRAERGRATALEIRDHRDRVKAWGARTPPEDRVR